VRDGSRPQQQRCVHWHLGASAHTLCVQAQARTRAQPTAGREHPPLQRACAPLITPGRCRWPWAGAGDRPDTPPRPAARRRGRGARPAAGTARSRGRRAHGAHGAASSQARVSRQAGGRGVGAWCCGRWHATQLQPRTRRLRWPSSARQRRAGAGPRCQTRTGPRPSGQSRRRSRRRRRWPRAAPPGTQSVRRCCARWRCRGCRAWPSTPPWARPPVQRQRRRARVQQVKSVGGACGACGA
jgi:hypothetical protein